MKVDPLIRKDQEDGPFYVYSKEVKGDRINKNEIKRKVDKEKFLNVINSLLGIGKTKYLTELELKENCIEWIESTLSNFPDINDKYMEFLIKDFTDSMYTRMRRGKVCSSNSNEKFFNSLP